MSDPPRVWFSAPQDPEHWDPWAPDDWIDYRRLRSWARHPILTFRWWRYMNPRW